MADLQPHPEIQELAEIGSLVSKTFFYCPVLNGVIKTQFALFEPIIQQAIEDIKDGAQQASVVNFIDSFSFCKRTGEFLEHNLREKCQEYLKENGLFGKMSHYLLQDDFISNTVLINSVDEYDNISINNGWLCFPIHSQFDNDWEFVERFRGNLILPSQIENIKILPKELKEKRIFAIE
jgi:hypothetical protein